MRRLLAQVVRWGILGALTSQLVALAVFACEIRPSGARPLRAQELRPPSFLSGAWPEPSEGTSRGGWGSPCTRVELLCPAAAPPDFRDRPPLFQLVEDSYGWPARSLVMYRAAVITAGANAGSIDLIAFRRDFDTRAGLRRGIHGPGWFAGSVLGSEVPVWPVWRGLIVNAACYGVLAMGTVAALRGVRRARRRRLGRCAACGYPAGELATCPECGAPLLDCCSSGR